MKARQIHEHLMSLDGGWVQRDKTVDTFKSGDPEAEVTGIAVAWMSAFGELRRAVDLGCNLFVTHEPTYYHHWDNDEKVFRYPGAQAKRRYIEETGLIILRCHDLWDQVPGIGIPDSWGRQLGFRDPVGGSGYYRVYDVSGRTARDVAAQVARRTQSLGQEAVQLIGPGDAPVTRAAIGTGAITPFMQMIDDCGADLAICTDDGFAYWRDGALATDLGIPVVVVNHAVSEIHGMRLLADHLAERFPDLRVRFLPQGCIYRLVTG